MKKAVVDFVCAFIIFSIVLISVTVLINAGFFEGSVLWDRETLTLSLFDKSFTLDRRIPDTVYRLLEVNDLFFGRGFSKTAKYAVSAVFGFTEDFLTLSYNFAKDITGVI